MANEILYALNAMKKTRVGHLSRLTLQKVLYLSGALSPLKDILLEYLKYNTEKLGPYERRIQNTVDHLVGIGLVDVDYFQETSKGGALTHYVISHLGEEVVARLVQYPNEEEKAWWISLIADMTCSYLMAPDLHGNVDEKVRSLVYQDPTYQPFRNKNLFRRLIDLSDKRGLTYQFVEFLKKEAGQEYMMNSSINERGKVAILLVVFMEYLYTGVLNEAH